jgi:hypothetical protein
MATGYGSVAPNHSHGRESGRRASASVAGPLDSVAAMSSRTCAKPGCNTSATSTLTYDYANRTAWLERLGVEAHPMRYDLCTEHANGLRVPQGWALQDRRVRYPAALPQSIAS